MKKKKKICREKESRDRNSKVTKGREKERRTRVDRFYDPRASSRLSTAKSTIIRLERRNGINRDNRPSSTTPPNDVEIIVHVEFYHVFPSFVFLLRTHTHTYTLTHLAKTTAIENSALASHRAFLR